MAACRSVLLHHKLLAGSLPESAAEIDLGILHLDLAKGENRTEEFLRNNPLGVVPTLMTPWGALWESRAIMIYFAELAQQTNPSADAFYPRAVYQRARCNQMLNWDQGTFYKAIAACVYPQLFRDQAPSHEDLAALEKVFDFLSEWLGTRDFIVGPKPCIADISIAMGATMLRLVDLELDGLAIVAAWSARMRELPHWEEVNVPF